MHCSACDRLLTDFEATRRNALNHQFVDLCKVCYEDVKGLFPVIERKDLITESDLDLDGDDDGLECTDTEDIEDTRGLYKNYIDSNDTYGDS